MTWEELRGYTLGQVLTMLRLEEERQTRADVRSARVCWILANINRDKKLKPQPFDLFDFMPGWEKRPLTEEEQIAQFHRLWSPPSGRK